MILYIFSVHDKAVGAFLPPMFMRARGEAVRAFTEAVNNRDHQFSKHVLDYTLMSMGEYDDVSGTFRVCEPERVVSAVECLDDPFTPETQIGNAVSAGAAVVGTRARNGGGR